MAACRFLFLSVLSLLLLAGGPKAVGQPATNEAGNDHTRIHLRLADQDPLQAQFTMGLIAIKTGNYEAAIEILKDLSNKTPSPRVKLELARAYYLGQYFNKAKEIFQDLYDKSSIPFSVKRNIKLYLDEIDIVLGFVKFDFSLVSDSNPRNFTSSKEVMIAGQLLKVTPPADNKEVRGIKYQVRTGKALTQSRRLIGFANLSYTDFPDSHFDRWTGDGGLIYHFQFQPKLKSRLGWERSDLDNTKQYDFPYLSMIYTPDPTKQFRLNHELKIGRLHVPVADYLSATVYNLTSNFYRPFSGDILLKGDIDFEIAKAKEDPYSYRGASLGLGIEVPLDSWWVEFYGAIGKRLYGDKDPFFMITRNDTRKKLGITIKRDNFTILGMTPEIGLLYERTDSSIDFDSFDKVSFIFGLVSD